MISYDRHLKTSVQSITKSVKNDLEVSNFTEQLFFGGTHEKHIVYFILHCELYAIVSSFQLYSHDVYKYNQQTKGFFKFLSLSGRSTSISKELFDLPLPLYLPES